jgi:hypothetical protein
MTSTKWVRAYCRIVPDKPEAYREMTARLWDEVKGPLLLKDLEQALSGMGRERAERTLESM